MKKTVKKNVRRSKAQIFSLDLLIAVAVLTLSIGAALHFNELASRQMTHAYSSDSNAAATIAEALASGQALNSTPEYCFRYSNGTGTCAAFSCTGNVLAARKIIDCGGSACLLEVRACGE